MVRECYQCGKVLGETAPLENKNITSGLCTYCCFKMMFKIEIDYFFKYVKGIILLIIPMFFNK